MSEETYVPAEQPAENSDAFESDESEAAEQSSTGPDAGQDESYEAVAAASDDEAEVESESADWLPKEQEKVFSDEDYLRYAEARYPEIVKLLEDDPTNGQLRQLLHDKINSDIYLKQLEAMQQEQPEEPEQTAEAPADPVTQQTQQYWEAVDTWIESNTAPEVAQAFHRDFMEAFGADPSEADPQQAMALTSVMSRYGVNLMRSALPAMLFSAGPNGEPSLLEQAIEARYGEFAQSLQEYSRSRAWDTVRQSSAEFQELPAYNTPQFHAALERVAEAVPGFEEAVFRGADGQLLSPRENFQRKAEIAAHIMAGQAISAPELSKAIETGRRMERQAAAAARRGSLGAGQSRGMIANRGGRGNDDIFGGPGELRLSQRV